MNRQAACLKSPRIVNMGFVLTGVVSERLQWRALDLVRLNLHNQPATS